MKAAENESLYMRKLWFVFIFALIVGLLLMPNTNQKVFAITSSSVISSSKNNVSPNIIVNPVNGPSFTNQLEKRAQVSWPWYVSRAAGFVAAFCLIILMLSGIGFITGNTFKFLEPLTAWASHKAVAYVFAVSGTIHVVALLFDKFVPFTIAQALLPFISNYREVKINGMHFGSLYVALGIISMYFVIAIILTSILWVDKKPHTWKMFHFLAYLTMLFVFFHALYLGTDLTHGVFRALWIIFGVVVAIAIVFRLRRKSKAL